MASCRKLRKAECVGPSCKWIVGTGCKPDTRTINAKEPNSKSPKAISLNNHMGLDSAVAAFLNSLDAKMRRDPNFNVLTTLLQQFVKWETKDGSTIYRPRKTPTNFSDMNTNTQRLIASKLSGKDLGLFAIASKQNLDLVGEDRFKSTKHREEDLGEIARSQVEIRDVFYAGDFPSFYVNMKQDSKDADIRFVINLVPKVANAKDPLTFFFNFTHKFEKGAKWEFVLETHKHMSLTGDIVKLFNIDGKPTLMGNKIGFGGNTQLKRQELSEHLAKALYDSLMEMIKTFSYKIEQVLVDVEGRSATRLYVSIKRTWNNNEY
jgi:hypothetical protein